MDVSDWLLSSGLAEEVKAERRQHPSGGEEESPGCPSGVDEWSFGIFNGRLLAF